MPKVLIATEKPLAAEAVNKIKAELEAAKYEYEFLENYTEAAQLMTISTSKPPPLTTWLP